MSRANVDAVRVAYDVAYAQRSVEGVRDRFAADFRWHMRPEWPGRPLYVADEMTTLWADLDDTFDEFLLTPEDFEELGDYVLVRVHQSARLRGSDERFTESGYHLWLVKDGVPQEARAFGTRTDALQFAGAPS